MNNIEINYDNLKHFCDINDFVLISEEELKKENMYKNFVYSTNNNFTGMRVYPIDMPVIMNKEMWERLKLINNELKKYNKALKIYDAFRPNVIQRIFWDNFYETHGYHDEGLVANPDKYGGHNIKLNAVDIIMCNIDGTDLDMPSLFDDFTGKASINYNGCSEIQKLNRELLIKVCSKYGLIVNKDEFWHYTLDILENMKLNGNYNIESLIPKEVDKTFILSDKKLSL